MVLQITQMLVPVSKYDIKCPYYMDPEGVTIHETGNKVSAMAEISYMIGNNYEISYHFAVDDKHAVQGLPLNRNGWHAGDKATGRGNRKTIGVEHCYNWDGVRTTKNDSVYNPLYQESLKNGIKLVANLFIQFPSWGVPEHGKNIWRHYDHSKKNCPQRLIEEGRWNWYVAQVKKRYFELKKTPGAVYEVTSTNGIERVEEDTGSFKANDDILVRDRPSTNGKHIATYKKGDILDAYNRVHYGNGYVWLEYSRVGANPSKGYLPIRTYRNGVYGDMWGEIGKVGDYVSKPVKPVTKPKNQNRGGIVKMSGTFQAQEEIIARDKPSTSGRHVATYYAGENVKYDRLHMKNGYVWLEYKRNKGGKGYIPIAPTSEVWGTLK